MQNIKAYDPIFYAANALLKLRKTLGMASRVYRGYDEVAQRKGSTIQIRKPSTFTAQDAPSVKQDVDASSVEVKLDYWRDVVFALSDKDLALSDERLISDHIEPAAYALADDLDQKLVGLYKKVPNYYGTPGTTPGTVDDITLAKKVMKDNLVNFNDPTKIHAQINTTLEAKLTALQAFAQFQGAGMEGVNTQITGDIGRKYGFNWASNQNILSHTKGTASTGTLAVKGATAKGAVIITLDAVAVTGTLVAGDSFVIAGNSQRYVVDALSTAGTNEFTNVSIFPPLVADVADNAVVTVFLGNGARNMLFHQNAFCLATAPLSSPEAIAFAREMGAKVEVVSDPITGMTLRCAIWWEGKEKATYVSLDILYGIKCLDPQLALNLVGE